MKDGKIDMAAALKYLCIIYIESWRLRPGKVTYHSVLNCNTAVKYDYINQKDIEIKYYRIFSETFNSYEECQFQIETVLLLGEWRKGEAHSCIDT